MIADAADKDRHLTETELFTQQMQKVRLASNEARSASYLTAMDRQLLTTRSVGQNTPQASRLALSGCLSTYGRPMHAGNRFACFLASARDQHGCELLLHPAEGKFVRLIACSRCSPVAHKLDLITFTIAASVI